MRIMDIINPWGALRRMRRNIAALEQKMQQAHFRNPKTGRLGKRGETFS